VLGTVIQYLQEEGIHLEVKARKVA
jgi:hypothetical protein